MILANAAPYLSQDDPPVPANASSHIFPTSNPRPRFPDSLPNPALSPSSTYSSTAVSPNATRLSDSRDDRSYPSPTARAALAPPQQEYRPMSAPVAAGPSPSSAGIGISLVPDQQVARRGDAAALVVGVVVERACVYKCVRLCVCTRARAFVRVCTRGNTEIIFVCARLQGNLRIASMVPGGAAMRSGELSIFHASSLPESDSEPT
eukprot:2927702-Rhodomonas_salina.4